MLVQLFKSLNEKYPPPEKNKHVITFGPEGKSIILYIWIDGGVHGFEIEEEELKDPKEILAIIEHAFNELMAISGNLYAERDHMAQGDYYIKHACAMTREKLHAKSAIAGELAHRDIQIDRLQAQLDHLLKLYSEVGDGK